MKLKSLFVFKANIIEPCSKLLSKFNKLKPSSIKVRPRKRSSCIRTKAKRAIRIRRKRTVKPVEKPVPKVGVAEPVTVVLSVKKVEEIEEDDGNTIMADPGSVGRLPFPLPITPLFASDSGASSTKEESSEDTEDVEDSCRSFENYLVEMIVEEGELKDLKDVEELLYCWRKLKSPIFIDFVSMLYGQLFKDLFSPSEEAES